MPVLETVDVVGQYASPRQAVGAVRLTLGQHFDELVEAGVRPFQRGGKIEVQGYISPFGLTEDFSSESEEAYKRHQAEGGVEGLTIRRDAKTGAIAYASMHGHLPARLSDEEAGGLFRADSWSTRLHFPPKHDGQEVQRLVVGSYQIPMTHLTLAANALSAARSAEREAAYSELFANMCRRTDAAGVPIGAVAISHTVYGRGNYLQEGDVTALNTVMGTFAEGVHDAVAWQHHIAAEIAAERNQ